MEKSVLLLNSSEEVVNLISWKKAINLIFSGKAVEPHGHEEFHQIFTVKGHYNLPTVLVLAEYVQIPYSTASLTRKNVMKRDESKCQYCGKSLSNNMETIDHIVPVSRGGKKADWKNVVACCKPCNMFKADRTPEEANMKLLRQPFVPTKRVLVFKVISRSGMKSWQKWLNF